jgi:hypothetical protein
VVFILSVPRGLAKLSSFANDKGFSQVAHKIL